MKSAFLHILLSTVFMIFMTACDDDNPSGPNVPDPTSMDSIDIADDFDFKTSRRVNLRVEVKVSDNTPLKGIRVLTYDDTYREGGPYASSAKLAGITNSSGVYEIGFDVPTYNESIFVQAGFIGGINYAEILRSSDNLSYSFNNTPVIRSEKNGKGGLPQIDDLVHFPEPTITDNNMSIIISYINGIEVVQGAEIACITTDGLIAGADTLSPEIEVWGMAVWGNDASSDEIDGFRGGELLTFIYWDPASQQELDVILQNRENDPAVYRANGFLAVEMFIEVTSSYVYLGTWNNDGVPDYLKESSEDYSGSLLQHLSNLLPDEGGASEFHSDLLSENNHIELNESAEILVSFLHENSIYRNALGFYNYRTDSPPQNVDEIGAITIIYPNASFQRDGGGMISGNTVNIGSFTENESIGWVLISNGWNDQGIDTTVAQYYSDESFNPEAGNLSIHSLLFFDQESGRLVLGFEDNQRDGNRDDFSDVIFTIRSEPENAINLDNINLVPRDIVYRDSDNDQVFDKIDDYPADTDRAFRNHFPLFESSGVIAFEEDWPQTGDYDYNDLVMNYRFELFADSANQVTEIEGKFQVQALGSESHHGFGFQMPVTPDLVRSVTGYEINANYIQLANNGLESGQDSAVVIVIDDVLSVMSPAGNFSTINTEDGSPEVNSPEITIRIVLQQPLDFAVLGSPPFNPFLIMNGQRGFEIHPVNHPPTNLIDSELFNTQSDISVPANGIYFKSDKNLPWCFVLPWDWTQPLEGAGLNNAYINFKSWAESSGSLAKNWYFPIDGNVDAEQLWIAQ